MKKIVKLTESDLTRIVKRVIREQIHTDDYMDELEKIYRFRDDRFFHVEGEDRRTANQLLKNFLKVSNGKASFIAFTQSSCVDRRPPSRPTSRPTDRPIDKANSGHTNKIRTMPIQPATTPDHSDVQSI